MLSIQHSGSRHQAVNALVDGPLVQVPWALDEGLRLGQTVRYLDADNIVRSGEISSFDPRVGREENRVYFYGKDRFGGQPWAYLTGIIAPEHAILVPGLKIKSLHVTYDLRTEGSDMAGDAEQMGSDDLVLFEPSNDAVDETIYALRRKGPFRLSAPAWHPGVTYTQAEGRDATSWDSKDATKWCSYTLGGFSAEEEHRVYMALVARGLVD